MNFIFKTDDTGKRVIVDGHYLVKTHRDGSWWERPVDDIDAWMAGMERGHDERMVQVAALAADRGRAPSVRELIARGDIKPEHVRVAQPAVMTQELDDQPQHDGASSIWAPIVARYTTRAMQAMRT